MLKVTKGAGQARRKRSGRLRQRLARGMPLAVLTVALLILGLAVRIHDPSALGQLRNMVFDEYQRFHPHTYDPASPVRIVAIDDGSLQRLGQWPWPRVRLAEIVTKLRDLGAAAIGLDVILAEPDRMSPENIATLLPEGADRQKLVDALATAPRNDILLASALLSSPSVLGVALDKAPPDPGVGDTSTARRAFAQPKAGFAFAGDDPRIFLPSFQDATPPLPLLSQAAAGLGALNWLPDRDRIVRKVPLLFQLGEDTFVPSFAAEALRVAQGESTVMIRSSNASGQTAFGAKSGVNTVRIGGIEVPTTADGALQLHFHAAPTERQIPAWWVLEDIVPADEVAGRIILIGATAPGLPDIQATPLEEAVPGVEIHAQAIDHMVFGTQLKRPDWAPGLEVVVFAVLTVAFAIAAAVLSPFKNIVFGLVLLGGVAAGSYHLFAADSLLVDPSFAVLGGAISLLATTSWVAIHEGAERRYVRGAFGRYVASDLVEELANHHAQLTLGGEIKPMTILFTDIRGFTTISEGMSAEALTTFINNFLTPLTDVILHHRGTVDKYMGDAIMAFWNAPLDDPRHAAHAAETALDMLKALEQFNRDYHDTYPDVAIGIGLNTGECCVGNLGSTARFDYSVIGDDVNVASRLEGQTKTYGMPILIGPRTAAEVVEHGYKVISLDNIKVKGKDIPIEIFALVGGPNHAVAPAIASAEPTINALTEAYRAKDLTQMAVAMSALEAADAPELRPLVAIYRDRLALLTMPSPEAATEPEGVKALREASQLGTA
ncbi:MAG: adenylate/guanylate cyclase domain-containing protein [Acuticoccus sp.]